MEIEKAFNSTVHLSFQVCKNKKVFHILSIITFPRNIIQEGVAFHPIRAQIIVSSEREQTQLRKQRVFSLEWKNI